MFKLHKDTDRLLARSIFGGVKAGEYVSIEYLYDLYRYVSGKEEAEKPMDFKTYSVALAKALREDELLIDFVYELNSCKILF